MLLVFSCLKMFQLGGDGAIFHVAVENSSHCQMWCHHFLQFPPAPPVSSAAARWLRLCASWSSLPVESCGCVSQCKASDEGRWVPLLIRTVLAIINRCWQELKLGTILSHFTVQQGQTQTERKREWLKTARQIHSVMLSGSMARTL